MMKSTILSTVFALALAVSGCSAKPVAGTCMLYSGMACMTFIGKTYIDNPEATLSACAGLPAEQKPEFGKTPCPAKEMIGTCTHFAKTPDEIATRYYPGKTNMPEQIAAAARETCAKTNGVWKEADRKKIEKTQSSEPGTKKEERPTTLKNTTNSPETTATKAVAKKNK